MNALTFWEGHDLGLALFFRGLGLIYLVAFVSLWSQLAGLFSSRGIRPIAEFLDHWRNAPVSARLTSIPTLFWFSASDSTLRASCAAGTLLSLIVISGNEATGPCLLGLWLLYLSFVTVGQEFLSFQWDSLLLETGSLAVLAAPWPGLPAASPLASLLIVWLLFRLLFESGVVKWTSGDEAWRRLTALNYHHYTQPLPTRFAWYLQQAPAVFHRASVVLVFLLELVPPFLLWGPEPLRIAAFLLVLGLQGAIAVSGNYGFFNYLTIVLALPLLANATYQKILSTSWVPALSASEWSSPRLFVEMPFAVVIALISVNQLRRCFNPMRRGSLWLRKGERAVRPFYLSNPYGLFRVMTTSRYELRIEGTLDGQEWKAYRFRYKPNDTQTAPTWSQPHLPRVDWQMWFAALGSLDSNPWLESLLSRLFEGEPAVLKLFAENPFPDQPPLYLRITQADYQFTTIKERKQTASWWRASPLGLYCPPVYRATSV